ncbi:MAG: hypothetical protein QW176_04675 [Candidatus Bathyarchaeia archaeon]
MGGGEAMNPKGRVKAGMGGEAPKVKATRGITVPSDGGFQKLIVEAEIPIQRGITADLQFLRSQLDRVIEDFRKDHAPGRSKEGREAEIRGSASHDGWRPWHNGRGESKPAEADPGLARFLEAKGYRFGNRWASRDGYEYWLSTLESGAKFIQRTRKGKKHPPRSRTGLQPIEDVEPINVRSD